LRCSTQLLPLPANDATVLESNVNLPDSAKSLDELPKKHFGCIYADPPWQYGNQGTRAATNNHYQTMTIADLCAMPVESLVADDAHLHLWTTNAFIQEAFVVIKAWGFEYRSMFIWVKPQMGIGNYWRVSHEIMLLGIRGNAKRFNDRSLKSWTEASRTKHSAKPESVRNMVEKASHGPYLELFGRKLVKGWTVFGNQVGASYQQTFDYSDLPS
jgi:N6-adenosine-specific RNA methylase IME4